jgi:hypothetical protein
MRLHRPGQWFFLSPEKLYFSSCDSVLLGVQYNTVNIPYIAHLSDKYNNKKGPVKAKKGFGSNPKSNFAFSATKYNGDFLRLPSLVNLSL